VMSLAYFYLLSFAASAWLLHSDYIRHPKLLSIIYLSLFSCKRLQQNQVPTSFGEIVISVDRFLSPIVSALSTNNPSPVKWIAPGPWA